jgi:hypothetical protein
VTFVTDELADFRAPALELTPASSIRTRAVHWLWDGWLPRGKVTILDGRPGLGKSSMGIDVVARLTTGRPMPDGYDPGLGPANAVIVSAEDDWEDTIAPRLIAAGADMARVFHLGDLSLPDDCERLQAAIEGVGAKLLVIDPIVAFVPVRYDLHKDQSARFVLKPLGKVAADTDCSVLALRHINKAAEQAAQDRGTGSVAIGGAARSHLLVGTDPDVLQQFVLAAVKANLGRRHSPIGYLLEGRAIDTDDGETSNVSIVRWLGEMDVTLDEMLTPSGQGAAVAFLRNALADGPVASKELEKQARNEGLSWTGAIRRASERMKVIKRPEGKQGEWSWSLSTPYRSSESSESRPRVEQPNPVLSSIEQGVDREVKTSPDPDGRNGTPLAFAERFAAQQAAAWDVFENRKPS